MSILIGNNLEGVEGRLCTFYFLPVNCRLQYPNLLRKNHWNAGIFEKPQLVLRKLTET